MRHPLDMGWIEIAKRSLDFENQPLQEVKFPEIRVDTYRVRFEFTNTRSTQGI
jgi:hypothetical protein